MHIYVYMLSCAGGRAVEDDMEKKDLCSSREPMMFHQMKLEKETKKLFKWRGKCELKPGMGEVRF